MEPSVSRCIYLMHLLYGICVRILIVNPTGIFQRATKRARILLKDNLQSGAAVVSTITSHFYLVLRSIFAFS